MSALVEQQRALDLYGVAVYWRVALDGDSLDGDRSRWHLEAALQRSAVAAGATLEQLDDARDYARDCVLHRRKPLMAGSSFEQFQREAQR